MYKDVIEISAIGTRGKAEGNKFTAKPNRDGKIVLNRRSKQTNLAKNKRLVDSLTEAANLLASGDYLINVSCPDGTRALRSFDRVKIISGTTDQQ